MARLGLKIFYLRTRDQKLSQQELADRLGVRQATLSNIERGRMLPTLPLLIEFCRYFDVTPNYLLDEERGVEPLPTERWSMRNHLVTTDMWVEVKASEVRRLPDGKLLCPLLPGESFFDDEARERREADITRASVQELETERARKRRALEAALDAELEMPPRARLGSRS
ncbi:MAG TPA: helix-turn-helix transcriptional regulator [Planctomycetota bacterium]|nr:helix-turn-helix transcriptional regulator [Planctomycetota bacterium]